MAQVGTSFEVDCCWFVESKTDADYAGQSYTNMVHKVE